MRLSHKSRKARAGGVSKLRKSSKNHNTFWNFGLCCILVIALAVIVVTFTFDILIYTGLLEPPPTYHIWNAWHEEATKKSENCPPLGLSSEPHPLPKVDPYKAWLLRQEYSPPPNDTLKSIHCLPTYDDQGFPMKNEIWHQELQDLYAGNQQSIPVLPPLGDRSIITANGARITCWPRNGGVWIKHANLADLQYLNLSTTVNTPRPMEETIEKMIREENRFCETLLVLGADFYEMPSNFSNSSHCNCAPLEYCDFGPTFHHRFGVALVEKDHAYIFDFKKAWEKYGPGLNGYYNAPTMEDRARIIKSFDDTLDCQEEWKECARLWLDSYPKNRWELKKLTGGRPTEDDVFDDYETDIREFWDLAFL